MDKITHYEAQLDKELSKIPQLVQLQEQTGVKKTYMAAGVGVILFIMIFFNLAGGLITNVVGFVYPAYASFKAIESASKNDDTQWLTYWTVFAAFNIIEFFADIILYWIPFYYLLKTLTLIWLYLPSFRGAEYVYRSVLAPYLLSHQAKIDSTIKEIKTKAEAVTESLQSNTADSQ